MQIYIVAFMDIDTEKRFLLGASVDLMEAEELAEDYIDYLICEGYRADSVSENSDRRFSPIMKSWTLSHPRPRTSRNEKNISVELYQTDENGRIW